MRVPVRVIEWLEMKKNVIARIAKLQAEGRCLACEQPLDDGKTVRGCHMRCAKATYRAIAANKTTDSKRVEDGKWLPAAEGGRPPSNPVTIELSGT
jgi:hypothetical protein